MANVVLPVTKVPVELGTGYCPASYQQFNTDIMQAEMFVDLGNISTVITDTVPPDETVSPNETSTWLKTDDAGAPIRFYRWSGTPYSLWLSPHPVPPSSPELRMWRGTPDQLVTYEGDARSSNPLSTTSGPFWAIVADLTGRVPIGVNSAVDANAPPVDATLPEIDRGELNTATGEVMIAENSLPEHAHPVGIFDSGMDDVHLFKEASTTAIPSTLARKVSGEGGLAEASFTSADVWTLDLIVGHATSSTRVPDPVPIMPPGVGVYFIGRTIRQYYAEP